MFFGKAEMLVLVTPGEPPTESSRKRGRLATKIQRCYVIEPRKLLQILIVHKITHSAATDSSL